MGCTVAPVWSRSTARSPAWPISEGFAFLAPPVVGGVGVLEHAVGGRLWGRLRRIEMGFIRALVRKCRGVVVDAVVHFMPGPAK